MKTNGKSARLDNQEGFAALIIAIVLVIILGLITVGFAELMRHSQQQELNRHLSDQAYYAAESGINDAIRAVHDTPSLEKTDCGPDPANKYLNDQNVSNDTSPGSPRWTCLLINPAPTSLVYNPIDTVTPRALMLEPYYGGHSVDIKRLDIYWQGTDNSTAFRSGYTAGSSFPPLSSWNSIGMIRVGLTPLASVGRAALIDNTYSAFLYPSSGAVGGVGSTTYKSGSDWSKQGDVIEGNCNANSSPRFCHIKITGIASGNNKYLLSLRSIYSPTNVFIEGYADDAGTQLVTFKNSQTVIDSTGRSQNVLKRLQVRIQPTPRSYPFPGFAAEAAGNICKQLSAYPGSVVMNCPSP